jgi:hypothetical protein
LLETEPKDERDGCGQIHRGAYSLDGAQEDAGHFRARETSSKGGEAHEEQPANEHVL